MKKLLQIVTVFALLLGVFAGSGTALAGTRSADGNTGKGVNRYTPGQVLIQFKPSTGKAAKAEARALAGATKKRTLRTLPSAGRGDLELAALPKGRSVEEAIRRLENHRSVAFAEPNWIYTQQAESNDPYYMDGKLYGMYGDATSPANQYGTQAGEAWAAGHTGSKNVYVGVIDEGMDYKHLDLATPGADGQMGTCDDGGNTWRNPGECGVDANGRDKTANGLDDDGNGYADDYYGWDFLGNNKTCYDGNADNQGEKHGTHVAGTIGALGNNSRGVVGVNWNVTVICGKFLGGNGGSLSDAVEAVDYFTNLKLKLGMNIVATNNSWGGGGYSQALYDAIQRANNAGILFIAAAGNGGSDGIGDDNDITPHYPSSYSNSNVISVASTNNAGGRSTFSNYGLESVDIGAPGTSIYSTLPSYLSTPYGAYSGTSMATPHVTGAAAMYKSVYPDASATQIRTAIFNSAIPTAAIARDSSTPVATGGRLDVPGMLGLVLTAPSEPQNLTAQTPTKGKGVLLKWQAPASNGGSPVTGYKIYRRTATGSSTLLKSVSNVLSYTDSNTRTGTLYYYTVSAVNSIGEGPKSNEAGAKAK